MLRGRYFGRKAPNKRLVRTPNGLSPLDVTLTTNAGAHPEVNIGLKADHFANDFLELQRFASADASGTKTLDISYQITLSDFSDGITNAELATEGYVDPTGGVYYQRYRIRNGWGAVSPWVGFAGDSNLDETPGAFTFVDVTSAALSTSYESNLITCTSVDAGLTFGVPFTVTGGEYQKNGGSWTAAGSGTLLLNETIKVRHTSSAANLTATNTVLTINGVSDTFTTTTLPLAGDIVWSPETAPAWQTIGYGSGTANFASVNFGVGVGLIGVTSPRRRVEGCTVGGATATLVVESGTGLDAFHVSIWQINIASAGAKNVVFTTSSTFNEIGMSSGTMTNANPTAVDTAVKAVAYTPDPQETATTLDYASGGFGFIVAGCETANVPTYDNGTRQVFIGDANYSHSSGKLSNGGTKPSISNWAYTAPSMISAAWNKA